MPFFMILFDGSLNNSNKVFIGGFFQTIALRLVICRISQFKSHFDSKLKHRISRKIRCIIKNKSIRDTKPGNNELVYEFHNCLRLRCF